MTSGSAFSKTRWEAVRLRLLEVVADMKVGLIFIFLQPK
jgi:hypothetical protein